MALPYATLARVKDRLGITDTSADAILSRMCEEVNTYIETVTHRAIGSSSVTAEVIDGWRAQEGGYIVPYPRGLRSITSLEMRLTSDDDYSTVPTTDYSIRPEEPYRTPGWPGFEIMLTNLPSDGSTVPWVMPDAIGAVRHTSLIGWATMPEDLRGTAEVGVSRAWHARQSGFADSLGVDELGEVTVSRFLSSHDYRVIRRYAWKPTEII